jgi:cytochrome P450
MMGVRMQDWNDPEWFARTFQVWDDMFDTREPQPAYASVFAGGEPVQPIEGMAVVGSRTGIDAVALHADLFTAEGVIEMGNARPLIPISIDGPEHAFYRRVLEPLFAPARMDAYRPMLVKLMNELIDRIVDQGECDYVQAIATPFPSSAFLGLLGMPLEDLPELLAMKNGIMHPHEQTSDPAEIVLVQRGAADRIYDYYGAALDERERMPRDDILTELLNLDAEGRRLRREELLDICFNLMMAGLDTVAGALGCCMAYVAQHPDHRRLLVEDPSIIPDAVEELMRWESPVNGIFRRAAVDGELLGCPVHKGEAVNASLGAANIDPHEFPDPFVVDFRRRPNRHLAFGKGMHRCLGSHLARRQLRVALAEWHARIPDYELVPGQELTYGSPTRMVHSLRLRWNA